MQFLLTFVKCEGRLNRMEDEMNLSYPTLRSRLTEIVRALGYEPGKDEVPLTLSADAGEKSWTASTAERSCGRKPRPDCAVKNTPIQHPVPARRRSDGHQ
jgi:hypothetical protein